MKNEIKVAMNGITGRMGKNQHLIRSILELKKQGGFSLQNGDKVNVVPILVGRNRDKLQALATELNCKEYTTNIDKAIEQSDVFFDASLTQFRFKSLKKAMDQGKHVYCEKPLAHDLFHAQKLYEIAREKGVKHGVVQDKLFLPGLIKLKKLIKTGKIGSILSVRIDFGYWVFEGKDGILPQRPSWNYRKEDGGGIIIDMMCHWHYVVENLFGEIKSIYCCKRTHIKERVDEKNVSYAATADDAAYAIVELATGAVVQINSDWCTRVRRDDLVSFQVDGDKGSAVAGLSNCWYQARGKTPRFIWNPDVKQEHPFYSDWVEVDANKAFENGFLMQWKSFLRHVLENSPWAHGLDKGITNLHLAIAAEKSDLEKRLIELKEIKHEN